MRIKIGQLGDVLGYLDFDGRNVAVSGAHVDRVHRIVSHYAMQGYEGRDLLKRLLICLRGRTWAAPVNDDLSAASLATDDPSSRPRGQSRPVRDTTGKPGERDVSEGVRYQTERPGVEPTPPHGRVLYQEEQPGVEPKPPESESERSTAAPTPPTPGAAPPIQKRPSVAELQEQAQKEMADPSHPFNRLRSNFKEMTFAGQQIKTLQSTQEQLLSVSDHELSARAHRRVAGILQKAGDVKTSQAHFQASRWHDEAGRRLKAAEAQPPRPVIQTPQLSEYAQKVMSKMTVSLENARDLSPQQRQEYAVAMQAVLGRMNNRAISGVVANLKGIGWYKSMEDMTKTLSPGRFARGQLVAGAFRVHDSTLHLDGRKAGMGVESMKRPVGGRPGTTEEGYYSHEMAHVVDGKDFTYSSTNRWKDIWQKEIVATGLLGKYAATSNVEGWAEFGRLVWGSTQKREVIEQAMPLATAYWKELGFWS